MESSLSFLKKLKIELPCDPGRVSQVALEVKNPAANAGDIRDMVQSPGCEEFLKEGGHGNPLQYSCLENSMDRGVVGYSPWGRKESDTTEVTSHTRS